MDGYCEHYVRGDDESFLLDDENTDLKKCIRCRRQTNQWSNVESRDNNWTGNGFLLNVNGSETRLISSTDDMVDVLEDSPLLTNDSYNDEFHCHSILARDSDDTGAWRKLCIASILCCLFMFAEITGGYIAGSLAIMTDAAHLFSDFVGFLISLFSIWIARKSPTKHMTFGYHRAEVLGAFLSVLTIWFLAVVFVGLAINRLWNGAYDIDPDTMMVVASLGVIVNIVMGATLHGSLHSHGHSHGLKVANPSDHSNYNINVRAAAAHILGDLLQSIGVLIAAIIIKFFPNAKLADPICTLFFSLIIIFTTAQVAKDSVWVLLEGSPKYNNEVIYELKGISDVLHLHNFHIWALSPGKNAVSVHLNVDKNCDRDNILKKATSLIKSKLNVISCTIQIEVFNPEIISSCKQCQLHQC